MLDNLERPRGLRAQRASYEGWRLKVLSAVFDIPIIDRFRVSRSLLDTSVKRDLDTQKQIYFCDVENSSSRAPETEILRRQLS